MEYEKIKAWLDALIENMEQAQCLRDFNNQLRTINTKERHIQLFKGIEIAADVMGIPLNEKKVELEYGRYRYSFVYNNTTFTQLTDERLVNTDARQRRD